MKAQNSEIVTAETSSGHRVEIAVTRDLFDRAEGVVVQAWDSPDGDHIPTQQLKAFAWEYLPTAILKDFLAGVDGDGVGYVLGIYK